MRHVSPYVYMKRDVYHLVIRVSYTYITRHVSQEVYRDMFVVRRVSWQTYHDTLLVSYTPNVSYTCMAIHVLLLEYRNTCNTRHVSWYVYHTYITRITIHVSREVHCDMFVVRRVFYTRLTTNISYTHMAIHVLLLEYRDIFIAICLSR